MCHPLIVNQKVRHGWLFQPRKNSSLFSSTLLTTMSATVVSAPGKVLLAGGYLILDPKYSGIAVSTSSRFYSVISLASTPGAITVNSPQFTDAVWKYSIGLNGTVEAEYVAEGPYRLHRLTGPLQPVDYRCEQIHPSCVKKYLDPCRRFERPKGHRWFVADWPSDSCIRRQRFLFTKDHGMVVASAGSH